MSESPQIFIVKLGGALISHKDQYCTPNLAVVHEFARIVRSRWSELRTRLIIVLGGGSYGNGVSLRYNLHEASQPWNPADLSMVTVKIFEFMSLVTDIFRQEEVPCYPFQTSSYVMSLDGKPQTVFIEPILRVLAMGVVPILSGDMVFDSERGFVIFSSDGIPELFVGRVPIKRVVMLTNVPGVLTDAVHGSEIISRVTSDNRDAVLGCAGPSRQQDVSGGMANKVRALLRIADLGVESVICDGRSPAALVSAIFDATPSGTVIEATGARS